MANCKGKHLQRGTTSPVASLTSFTWQKIEGLPNHVIQQSQTTTETNEHHQHGEKSTFISQASNDLRCLSSFE